MDMEEIFFSVDIEINCSTIKEVLEEIFDDNSFGFDILQCKRIFDYLEEDESALTEILGCLLNTEYERLLFEWILDKGRGNIMMDFLKLELNEKYVGNLRQYFPFTNEVSIEEEELLLERGFEFELFFQHLALSRAYTSIHYVIFPSLSLIIPQILKEEYPETDLLTLDHSAWKHFLSRIEYITHLLDTFFCYQKGLPISPNRKGGRDWQKAIANLYKIAMALEEIKIMYEKLSGIEERAFNQTIWKRIAQTTKKIVWGKETVENLRNNPDRLIK